MRILFTTALLLFHSMSAWGDMTVNVSTTQGSTNPPGTFYTISVPAVTQMIAGKSAGQHVYIFVGLVHQANASGLVPVGFVSPNSTPYSSGGVSGTGVTVTDFTVDPNSLTAPPVNVNAAGSTNGMSVATDQGTVTVANTDAALGTLKPGESVMVVAGVGSNPNEALANAILSGNTATVYTSPDIMRVSPTSLSIGHTVGTTACPQRVGTFDIYNLFTDGSTLEAVATVDNQNFSLEYTTMVGFPLSTAVPVGFPSTVTVIFKCTAQPPQTATVTVKGYRGHDLAVLQTKTVSVTVSKN